MSNTLLESANSLDLSSLQMIYENTGIFFNCNDGMIVSDGLEQNEKTADVC